MKRPPQSKGKGKKKSRPTASFVTPTVSPFTMVQAKTISVHKRETSKAKEAWLQCALDAYQEALASDEVLSVREAAWHFNVPKTSLQKPINGPSSILESNDDTACCDA